MAGVPYTSLAARSRKKEGGGGGDRGEPFFSRKRCAQGSTLGGELLDLERHKNYTTPGPQTKHRRSIHAGTSSGQEEQTGPITGTSSGQEEQTGPITEQLISTNGDIPVHEVQTAVEAVGVSCNAPIQEGVSVYKERYSGVSALHLGGVTRAPIMVLCGVMPLQSLTLWSPLFRVGLTKEQQKEYTKYRRLTLLSLVSGFSLHVHTHTHTHTHTHIISSGWIRGFDGSWGKDPDVEFDSDEEPPQL